jgi:hypothetical protein
MTKAKPFDAPEYLTDDGTSATTSRRPSNRRPSTLRAAPGDAVKVRGMKQIAKCVGLIGKTLKRMLAYKHVNFFVIASVVGVRYSRSNGKLVIEYEAGWTSSIPITLFDYFARSIASRASLMAITWEGDKYERGSSQPSRSVVEN